MFEKINQLQKLLLELKDNLAFTTPLGVYELSHVIPSVREGRLIIGLKKPEKPYG